MRERDLRLDGWSDEWFFDKRRRRRDPNGEQHIKNPPPASQLREPRYRSYPPSTPDGWGYIQDWLQMTRI